MKRKTLILACLAVFLLGCAGGFAYLRFSPAGALNPESPDKAVKQLIDGMGFDFFASRISEGWTPEVTEFEDEDTVRQAALDALSGGALSFSRGEDFTAAAPVYIIYSEGRELCTVAMERAGDGWTVSSLLSGPALSPRALTLAVPRGGEAMINGVPVGSGYKTGEAAYDTLTETEAALSAPPMRDVYTVDGLYMDVTVSASREGVPLAEDASGSADFAFTASDTMTVLAPPGAKVSVCGFPVSPTGSAAPYEKLDFPEGYAPEAYDEYVFENLREIPAEVTAELNGKPLTPSGDGFDILFTPQGSDTLEAERRESVEAYMRAMLAYGAGQKLYSDVCFYVLPETELYNYFARAVTAVFWVRNEQLDVSSVDVHDFIPLADNCFVCTAEVECATKTYYESRALKLGYTLLYVQTSAGDWKAADMDCHTVETERIEQ